MSNVLIETYRTFDIHFNTDDETFSCVSVQLDDEKRGKKSYAAIKSYIDEFIKTNNEFKPFWIIGKPDSWRKIGARKGIGCATKKIEDKVAFLAARGQ